MYPNTGNTHSKYLKVNCILCTVKQVWYLIQQCRHIQTDLTMVMIYYMYCYCNCKWMFCVLPEGTKLSALEGLCIYNSAYAHIWCCAWWWFPCQSSTMGERCALLVEHKTIVSLPFDVPDNPWILLLGVPYTLKYMGHLYSHTCGMMYRFMQTRCCPSVCPKGTCLWLAVYVWYVDYVHDVMYWACSVEGIYLWPWS